MVDVVEGDGVASEYEGVGVSGGGEGGLLQLLQLLLKLCCGN